ncbi:MAG: protoporphyrinogen oxidase [Polyangiales bacterium]
MQSERMRVAVIGGGISGLTAAFRLQQAGAEVDVFEAGARAGGLLGSERIDGCVVETGADSILTEKPWALALAEDLGIGNAIIATRSQQRGAYVVHKGKLERVPHGFSLLAPTDFAAFVRSPLLSRQGKLRAGLELLLPRGLGGEASDDESLESFVVRRFGRELFEQLAQPLAGGIYGADPARLSLRATMPRFLELERRHGSVIRGMRARMRAGQPGEAQASGARYGLFAAFAGGMQDLVDGLTRPLGTRVHTSRPVTSIDRDEEGFHVIVRDESRCFDAVVMALPAHAASRVVRPLSAPLADLLGRIDYASAATITLSWPRYAIPHPLDAFGFVVPTIEHRGIIASTWASVKYAGRAPDGTALIRVFVGGHRGQHLVDHADDELIAIARRELSALIGVEAAPTFTKVVRYVRAMPQYHLGHLERVGRIEQAVHGIKGFALAGNAYRGVGIPDAVKSGEEAARKLIEATPRQRA